MITINIIWEDKSDRPGMNKMNLQVDWLFDTLKIQQQEYHAQLAIFKILPKHRCLCLQNVCCSDI